jgi:NAD(P)H-flavin reductase
MHRCGRWLLSPLKVQNNIKKLFFSRRARKYFSTVASISIPTPIPEMGGSLVKFPNRTKVLPVEYLKLPVHQESFHSVTIISREREAEGLFLITFQVPSAIVERYCSPGQYVKLRRKSNLSEAENNPVFYFAILSSPNNRILSFPVSSSTSSFSKSFSKLKPVPASSSSCTLSFLVKDIPAHSFLFDSSSSSSSVEIEMSFPLGNGFNLSALQSLVPSPPHHHSSSSKVCTPIMSSPSFKSLDDSLDELLDEPKIMDEEQLSDSRQLERIIFFTTGSGIAPIVSLIDSICFQSLFRTTSTPPLPSPVVVVQVYYGIKDFDHFPLQTKLMEWKERGIDIIPVFSNNSNDKNPSQQEPEEHHQQPQKQSQFPISYGHIQEIFLKNNNNNNSNSSSQCFPRTIAFLSGQR